MAKRKRSSAVAAPADSEVLLPPTLPSRASRRKTAAAVLDPNVNAQVLDGPNALRASPDSDDGNEKLLPRKLNGVGQSDASLADARDWVTRTVAQKKRPSAVAKTDHKFDEMVSAAATRKSALKESASTKANSQKIAEDVEAEDEDEEADPNEIIEALSRPPPVNSDRLPLPWKGRLGYACLCTYLRNANPSIFQSRTTRIASILEHRHPLKDPTQPEHPTKNRPDKDKPAEIRLGQQFVEQLCLANCRDMIKMLQWNEKYHIRFLRLSSEAFPFASHAEYGYKLAPFASEALAEVGKVVAELGHRVSVHPGQFTQLGSPRKQVIDASIRDLEYHDEMLSLLKLPPQQDRDAVMVLHMGGTFGDKEATLDRFRENYRSLSASIKNRLVLENDDMCWSVHDLLPICKELNIPFVLDFHHHNIIFDNTKIREGTKDIIDLFPEIRETWTRKGITQKMHYSEPTPAAITPKQRRKHSPRVATLPPCPNDMDLMIEAKDKEQAVFELMRTFKLPGYDSFSDIQPHIRRDDNKPTRMPTAKATSKKGNSKKAALELGEGEEQADSFIQTVIPEEEIGMGGPEGRVYWPPGMEEWLRPVKKVVKKKEPTESLNSKPMAEKARPKAASLHSAKKVNGETSTVTGAAAPKSNVNPSPKQNAAKRKVATKKSKVQLAVSGDEAEEEMTEEDSDEEDAEEEPLKRAKRGAGPRKSSRSNRVRVSYKEEDDEDDR